MSDSELIFFIANNNFDSLSRGTQPKPAEDYVIRQARSSFYSQYKVEEVLGQGTSSVVKRAMRKLDGLEVAVKVSILQIIACYVL